MLLVFIGGGIGAIFRYLISLLLNKHFIPWGTFFVNVLGCFMFGVLVGLVLQAQYKLLLLTGFCGGFTTFSTFASESAHLFTGTKHDFIKGVFYLTSTVIVGTIALFVGLKLLNFFA